MNIIISEINRSLGSALGRSYRDSRLDPALVSRDGVTIMEEK